MSIRKNLISFQAATSAAFARKLLDDYRKENTYLGIGDLLKMMTSHQTPEIRVEILKYLRKVGTIGVAR